MNPDKKACSCRNITYGKIVKTVLDGAENFEEVSEITGVSKSCGKCREFVESFVKDIVSHPEEYEA